jgi:hypothetical protein
MKKFILSIGTACSLALAVGCEHNGGGSYDPNIDPANFGGPIDNPYLPLKPGSVYHYRTTTDEDTESITVTVTHGVKVILGVNCVVVHDVASVDGDVEEDTFDWYAQDKDGNVWYFGEDTRSFGEDGVSTKGSWEAGVNGAKPGIVMKAHPKVGDAYRQEFSPGVAEDRAEVIGVGETVSVPFGTFSNCIRTKDFSDLEPDTIENKLFAPGVGEVSAEKVKGGVEHEVLVSANIR